MYTGVVGGLVATLDPPLGLTARPHPESGRKRGTLPRFGDSRGVQKGHFRGAKGSLSATGVNGVHAILQFRLL